MLTNKENMKTRPNRIKLTTSLIIIGFMVAPIVLSLIGTGLAILFNCHGASEASCSVPAMNNIITNLLVSAYLTFVTVPLGVVVLVIYAVVQSLRSSKHVSSGTSAGTQLPPVVEGFRLSRLDESWFATLSLSGLEIRTSVPDLLRSPDWPCAFDHAKKHLFVQLLSDTGQMREGYYEYLLAVNDEIVIISVDSYGARIMPTGAWQKLPRNLIVSLADSAAKIATAGQAPLKWDEARSARMR